MRYNSDGKCNTPAGSGPKNISGWRQSVVGRPSRDAITSLFPNREKFQDAHEALQGSKLCAGDFAQTVREMRRGDLGYFDPPYVGTYDDYTPEGFSDADQFQLAEMLREQSRRGVTVMISNSDTELVRRWYYWADEIIPTKESRTINSDTKGRVKAPCVLIVARGK
jgi:DNA adenine methylase